MSPERTCSRSRTSGFTIVEIAVTVAVIGLIGASSAAAFARLTQRSQDGLAVGAEMAVLSEAVVAFAATRHRLPCPSTDGSGWEGTNGVCAPGAQVGMFPYQAVGLPFPGLAAAARYGVYRNASADLATAREYTGDAAGRPDFAGRGDFVHALRAAAIRPASNAHPFVTGDGALNGAENCAGNVRGNPAFMIALPGTDRNGNGNAFDGIHLGLLDPGLCFAAPTRAHDSGFDDTSFALGFFALMARLNH